MRRRPASRGRSRERSTTARSRPGSSGTRAATSRSARPDRSAVGASRAASHRHDLAAAVDRVPGRRRPPAADGRNALRATASFAICTRTSGSGWSCRCARCTAPARRSSSITRARSRGSWIGETGEAIEVELFVTVLGAATTRTRRRRGRRGWRISARRRCARFEYFGGVPEIVGARPTAQRRERPGPLRPGHQSDVPELAQHYDVAIVPARPGKPRDKAKVEGAVLVAQRWILACLRNRTFFSLDELNAAIAELLEKLNDAALPEARGLPALGLRELDRPALRPLPHGALGAGRWATAKVNIDYHVDYDGRLYSVPHALVGERVEVRATRRRRRDLSRARRVASHARLWGPRGRPAPSPSTDRESHREYGAWPPSRIIGVGRVDRPRVGERSSSGSCSAARAGERVPIVHGADPKAKEYDQRALRRRLPARARDRRARTARASWRS